jgi:hypothetical protein
METPVIARLHGCAVVPVPFSGRDLLTTQLALAHKPKANGVKDVKPVSPAPRQIRQVASQEGILLNHGFRKRLLGSLVAAEERFDHRRCVAADNKPFPPAPGLDLPGQFPEVIAEERLRVEWLFHHKYPGLVLLKNRSEVLPHLGTGITARKCFHAVPDDLFAFQYGNPQILHTRIYCQDASCRRCHKLTALFRA